MSDILNTEQEKIYWSKRYEDGRTGWNIRQPSTPLKSYIDQLENKDLKILIPGAGEAYEAEYLFERGFKNVFVLEIASEPLKALKNRAPYIPQEQLLHNNFFEHEGEYDLILEQTFFCTLKPTDDNRNLYAKKSASLLRNSGKLVGLWFDSKLMNNANKRPYAGDKEDYLGYFEPHFEVLSFSKCYNSIPTRNGYEFFGIFRKK